MSERYKDIIINEREFRLSRVTASVGNWMILQMAAGTSISHEVYSKMEAYFLTGTSIYKGSGGVRNPMPIYDGGTWFDEDLKFDLDTVNAIYMESLKFNFDDFFAKRKAEAAERARLSNDQHAIRATIPSSGLRT